MSFLIVAPEMVTGAATGLGSIGSTVSAANAAVAAPTTAVLTAAGDEVSAAIAALFSRYGSEFQGQSAQVAKFHSQFVQTLDSAAGAYAGTEAANVRGLLTGQNGLGSVENQLTGAASVSSERLLRRGTIVGLFGVSRALPSDHQVRQYRPESHRAGPPVSHPAGGLPKRPGPKGDNLRGPLPKPPERVDGLRRG
jgi:hypothetical protein